MVTKSISAFSVRELDNQNAIISFRTSQIGGSGIGQYIAGSGATFTFHASGFVNRANVRNLIFVGDGFSPKKYDIEFFMTSSLISSERQYYYQDVNLRAIDVPQQPIFFVDNDNSNCLHGKITNNDTSTSGMWLNYISLKYNRLLEVS